MSAAEPLVPRTLGSSDDESPDRAARTFARHLAAEEPVEVQELAARALQAVLDGHSCIVLGDEEIGRLQGHRLTADDGPLVQRGNKLFLRRFDDDEATIARWASGRSSVAGLTIDDGVLARLFPTNTRDPLNHPLAACRHALGSRFTILTGGPGTGKTWTIARTIAALWHADPELDIALAAPTGKAAMRMRDAVLEAAHGLDEVLADRVRRLEPRTVHRLLGLAPGRAPRFGTHRRLPHDVLIVDEASMVSLPLMADLVRALPAKSRMILVGDPFQLASVEAGAVLGDLVDEASATAGAVARLDVNHRSDASFDALFRAVNDGDVERSLALLEPHLVDTTGIEDDLGALSDVTASLVDEQVELASELRDAAVSGDTKRCERLLETSKVLCATRAGALGVENWTRRVEAGIFGGRRHEVWYPGRPLIATRNDGITGLLNGDTGLCLSESVWFPSREFGFEELTDDLATWWAMTIHKSQGSEFDHVIVSLGPDTRIHTRELLYTALTRARSRLTVIASRDTLAATIARRSIRTSGLVDRLAVPGS